MKDVEMTGHIICIFESKSDLHKLSGEEASRGRQFQEFWETRTRGGGINCSVGMQPQERYVHL